MKKIHAKSPCCRARVVRFGERRRQCASCGCTWRIRQKRRGRKRARGYLPLLVRFLDHVIGSSKARAEHWKKSIRTFQREMVRGRDLFCRVTPWPPLPATAPLILLADATLKLIGKRWHTIYCMLLRCPDETVARIAPPVILQDKETTAGWATALNTLPADCLAKIRALVCDGRSGLVDYAKRHGWLIQRCHFHLIASIQGRRSRWGKSRHQEEGRRIYALVKRLLDAPAETDSTALRIAVDNLALSTDSRVLRKVLTGFATNAEDFRTYLFHSELKLPRTNNTSEAWIGLIESLLKRLRGISNIHSLAKWTEALAKHRKKIVCNGFLSTK